MLLKGSALSTGFHDEKEDKYVKGNCQFQQTEFTTLELSLFGVYRNPKLFTWGYPGLGHSNSPVTSLRSFIISPVISANSHATHHDGCIT